MSIIALYNQKGGVSKTTTTFNLGWALAQAGKRVIIVDMDPQCNLTGMSLALTGQDDFEEFYEKHGVSNVYDSLRPAFDSSPEKLKPAKLYEIKKRKNLFILPGHVRINDFEVKLGVSINLAGSLGNINLVGALGMLLTSTAKEYKADFILIDMNPAISSINQITFLTSNYFIIPATADYFCMQAIDQLSDLLPSWVRWLREAHSSGIFKKAAYPLPERAPIFIGTIMQRYKHRTGAPTKGFQMWIDKINKRIETRLVPELRQAEMLLPTKLQHDIAEKDDELYTIASIPDFNALIANSQEFNVPVFVLTDKQMGQVGKSLEIMKESQESFKKTFEGLASSIISVTK